MDAHTPGWAARVLSWVLREGDGAALLGDLAEEHARLVNADCRATAARWYRRQLYKSLAAVLRLRGVEFIRAMPWAIATVAYIVVGFLEVASRWLLSGTWPEKHTRRARFGWCSNVPASSRLRTPQRESVGTRRSCSAA
jgi:hypothetical protein